MPRHPGAGRAGPRPRRGLAAPGSGVRTGAAESPGTPGKPAPGPQRPGARGPGAPRAASPAASPGPVGDRGRAAPDRLFLTPEEVAPSRLPARKTKIVGTIGPTSCGKADLFQLCDAGLNVARLNFSHGDHASHREVVELVKEYNRTGKHTVAILLDTKGPEVRSGDLVQPLDLQAGDEVTFTVREGHKGVDNTVSVNYGGFVDDVEVGDHLLVDGGVMSFLIREKTATDVRVEVVDGGLMKARRHLNVRGRSASLPSITDKDWKDIDFGIQEGVDFFALSFVNDADVVHELRAYLEEKGADIKILVKIESCSAVQNLDAILQATDGAMVARGDLGAEMPVEDVPILQNSIIQKCRALGKPVIVATNMLESMIEHPTPTRAEVSDIAIAVREGTDAVMLSGETAYGRYPFKSLATMSEVARQTEASMLGSSFTGLRRAGSVESEPIDWIQGPHQTAAAGMSEVLAYHTTTMANTLNANIIVFTRHGNMPRLLAHYRPNARIFAFTDNEAVRRRLAIFYSVFPFKLDFEATADATFLKATAVLKQEGHLRAGDEVTLVQSGKAPIWRAGGTHTVSVRKVE